MHTMCRYRANIVSLLLAVNINIGHVNTVDNPRMGPRWRMVLLVLAYLLYLFLGATIFSAIEHPIERSVALLSLVSEHVLYLLITLRGMLKELENQRSEFLSKHKCVQGIIYQG